MKLLFLMAFVLLAMHSCIQTESRTEDPVEVVDTLASTEYQAISILGNGLSEIALSQRDQNNRLQKLEQAKLNFESNPDSLDYIIWYGRRLAYLSKYKESIDVYSEGLVKHPNSFELLRHRGHRFITTRQFDKAIKDLEEAAFHVRGLPPKIEPDGLPNRQNIPLSTVQFNIWYHLGLAYYLSGNYDKAISSYKQCMEVSVNDDLLVATTDWLYMTYRKIGNVELAEKLLDPIKKRMKLLENTEYHTRLLLYKGEKQPEDLIDISVAAAEETIENSTLGYGVANWYLYNSNTEQAKSILERIVQGERWDRFGYIAAEVDLNALGNL